MTTFLLDTHVVLWATAAPDRIGSKTTTRILDPASELVISTISAAELATKRSIGKLEMTVAITELAPPLGATWAELSLEAATAVEQLPMIHRGPVDRLIAAQALVDNSTLITADERWLAYPVGTLDARL